MHFIVDLRKLYSPIIHQKMGEVFFSPEPYQDSIHLESIFTPEPSWCEKNSDEMTMSVFKAIPVPSKDVCDDLAGDLEGFVKINANQLRFTMQFAVRTFLFPALLFLIGVLYIVPKNTMNFAHLPGLGCGITVIVMTL